jgi:hypothetical protein
VANRERVAKTNDEAALSTHPQMIVLLFVYRIGTKEDPVTQSSVRPDLLFVCRIGRRNRASSDSLSASSSFVAFQQNERTITGSFKRKM